MFTIAAPASASASSTERPAPVIAASNPLTPAGVLDGVWAQSPGAGLKYTWDLDGDGAYDDESPPPPWVTNGVYQNVTLGAGVHTLGVQATDRFGRVGTERRTFTVHGADLAPWTGFGPNTSERVASQPFVIPVFATSQWTSIARLEADVDGDGVFERYTRDPVGEFTLGGSYEVRTRVTDEHGLTSTASRTYNVTGPGQTASFTVFAADGERGRLVAGEPLRIVADAPATGRFEYDFDGDGTYESDQGSATTVTHAFGAGDHTVGLRATDAHGDVHTSRVGISVDPAGDAPWVSQSAPGGAVAGYQVMLQAESERGARTVAWDADGDGAFDDGSNELSANTPWSTVFFTYDAPGVHEIRTKVTDADGRSRIAMRTIDVAAAAQPLPPALSSFELPRVIRQDRATRFTIEADDGVAISFDLDGDGQFDDVPARDGDAYVWTFGAPVTIAAKVTGANGRSAVSTASVTPVAGIGIEADLDLSDPPRAGTPAHATASVDGDTSDCCTAAWDLDGDGAYDDATGLETTFTPAAGQVSIGVRVEDVDGAVTTTRREFTVGGEAPTVTVEASADDTTLTGNAVDPDGEPITSYEWDLDADGQFDDATGATIPRPEAGRVELKATDATGDIGVGSIDLSPLAEPDPDSDPAPSPPVDSNVVDPLKLSVRVSGVKLAKLLSSGLRVTPGCAQACDATVVVSTDKATASRLTQVGKASGTSRTLTVKLSAKARKALRRVRSVKLKVTVSATATGSRAGTAAQAVTIRR